MTAFTIWARIEKVANRRFVAKASAIPCGVAQRCAPEERAVECASLEAADAARELLMQRLAEDIRLRGNELVAS